MTKKKIITSSLILILVTISLISGVYLVKHRQEIRKQAAPTISTTTIYFEPSTKTVNVNQTVNFDILVDTDENALATIRLDIDYNSSLLQALSLTFNSSLLPQILKPIDLSQPGKITGSAGVIPGNSVSGSRQKVASVSFRTLSETLLGTSIDFGPDTSGYSAIPAEPMELNLIKTKVSAMIIATIPPTPTLTPTPIPTSTPTPVPTATPIPPTSTPIPTSTPTPIPTSTPTPTPTPSPTPSPTPTPVPKIGDVDRDGDVDEADYAAIITHFGERGTPGQVYADVNGDGDVDEIDYAAVIAHFGS